MIFVRSPKKNNLVTIQIPIYALYRLPPPLEAQISVFRFSAGWVE